MAVHNIHGIDIGSNVYSLNGTRLSQAYDISGNPLINVTPETRIDTVPNQASGTETGYSFWLNTEGYLYPLYDVLNLPSDITNFQSFGYDSDDDRFYRFNTSNTIDVYNSNLEKINTITLPASAEYNGGHKNDSYYIDGKFYWPGDYEMGTSGFFVWDISNNTVNIMPVTDIPSAITGAERVNSALCKVPNETDSLYLIYVDLQSDVLYHDSDDRLGIYKYNLLTHESTLIAEYLWDCIYVQGAEIYDDILYIACNSPTTGSAGNYSGITLKAFRTDDWNALTSLHLSGAIEPESMCLYPYGANPELMMGIAHYNALAKVTRFSIPYRLVQPSS